MIMMMPLSNSSIIEPEPTVTATDIAVMADSRVCGAPGPLGPSETRSRPLSGWPASPWLSSFK